MSKLPERRRRRQAFLEGALSIFLFGQNLHTYRRRPEDDEKALRGDWAKVHGDLERAVKGDKRTRRSP